MINKEQIMRILLEIFLQAKEGTISIESMDGIPYMYNTKFSVKSNNGYITTIDANDGITPILNVPNINYFIDALEPKINYYYNLYINDHSDLTYENMIKLICTTLFFNMTYNDFNNPIAYVNNLPRSVVIEDSFPLSLKDKNYNVDIVHSINPINLETIDSMRIILSGDDNTYTLPSISYQIEKDGSASIYSIQENKGTPRYTEVVAKDLPHVQGANNQHTRNISPSHLLSLTIALRTLKEKAGVTQFRFPLLLPIRYEGLVQTTIKKEISRCKKEGVPIDRTKIEEQAISHADSIQYNLTNKLYNTISRFMYHFENFEISNYDDNSNTIILKECRLPKEKDDILHQIYFAKSQTKQK